MKTTCIIILLAVFSTTTYAQSNYSPKAESIKQLNKMKGGLEKKFEGVMGEPTAIVGDINGDNRADCILSYVFSPKDGGNMIVGHQCTVFLNTGKGMRNGGNFPEFKFCYTPESIQNQLIMVRKYTCAPPYNDNLGTAKLAYKKGKVTLVK